MYLNPSIHRLNREMLLHFLCFSLLFFSISTFSQIKGYHQKGSVIHVTTPSLPPLPLPPPPPPPPPPPNFNQETSSLKPTVAIIVGFVTTIFSITFLLLLYVKHCKRGHLNNYSTTNNNINGAATGSAGGSRKNSGIDRMVIESLPVFRFGSLRGQKEGLECAVCLNKFEPTEFLKLLPKCNHAFHVQCVDTWLDAHSTCPLCRYRVHPEDILLIHNHNEAAAAAGFDSDNYNLLYPDQDQDEETGTIRRVSGRHSSAGERGKKSLQIVVESSQLNRTSLDSSRSLGLMKKKKKMEEEPLAGRRKDGLLLTAEKKAEETGSFERRFSHRIIVSDGGSGGAHSDDRWSDVNQSDLLYLRSEMIVSDSRRFSGL